MQQYTKQELILRADNLGITYGEKVILRGISFDIHNIVRPGLSQGQVVSLLGRSGIGKTQLFKMLAGLIRPTNGRVTIDTDQHEVQSGQVGVVPQNYILFNHRTIYQNLELGLKNSGGGKRTTKEEQEIIGDYADKFNLTEHLKKYPPQLSGGQRQRVSIIQQILTGNKFILLDEPFSGLDALMIDKVITLLLKVSNLNEMNTLIIVSHDIENTLAISDTAFIIANQPDKQGATLTETIDLITPGFAWDTQVRDNPQFKQLVKDIKFKI